MRYRKLGNTDIEVSVICQGCWGIAGGRTWGEQDRADSVAAVRTAVESGINFIETSENYGSDGESESLVAQAIEGLQRDEIVIATKVGQGNLAPADVKASCEASLARLRTDRIDLYQVHWPNPDVPVGDTLGALEVLRREGKIRAIGVSNFGTSFLRELFAVGYAVTNQIAYSLLFRPPEHEVIPLCVEQGMGILPYSAVAQGLLTGSFTTADEVPDGRARTRVFAGHRSEAIHGEPGCEEEAFAVVNRVRKISGELGVPMGRVALAWLLARPGVTSALVGARNAAQARDNAEAGDLVLADDVMAELTAVSEPVKAKLGTNCDPWRAPSRTEKG